VPEGYLEASAPGLSPDIPPRPPERLNDLKRETIKTFKEIGLILNGKPVDYQWASASVNALAIKLGHKDGLTMGEESDEAKLVQVHNEAVSVLRKLREKAASEDRGGPPFR
jgi:hypothetical protein